MLMVNTGATSATNPYATQTLTYFTDKLTDRELSEISKPAALASPDVSLTKPVGGGGPYTIYSKGRGMPSSVPPSSKIVVEEEDTPWGLIIAAAAITYMALKR
jgi:hypothetical protein